jgi:hypothetical protein
VSAQPDSSRESLYLEIAGSGGLGSINYEKQFLQEGITDLSWRVGFSIAPIDPNNGVGLVFPVMIHGLICSSPHKLELGVGQGITITTGGGFFILGTACVGYRYQSETSNWFYRVSYTPLISYLVDLQYQNWVGISIGYILGDRSK